MSAGSRYIQTDLKVRPLLRARAVATSAGERRRVQGLALALRRLSRDGGAHAADSAGSRRVSEMRNVAQVLHMRFGSSTQDTAGESFCV